MSETVTDVETPERRVSDLVAPFLDQRMTIARLALYAIAVVVAWTNRYVQDDAFITYRYSRNLARGHGLVWNLHENPPVQGYTNFLWTLIHAIPERMGWSSPLFSLLLGIPLMIATLWVAERYAARALGDARMGFLVACVLGGTITFLGYGVGGMETMLQTLLVTSVAALIVGVETTMLRRIAAGLLGALAILTRLDSVVLVGVAFVVCLVVQWRRDTDPGRLARVTRTAAELGVPMLAVVVPWLVWTYRFYGNILPNTFFAKSATNRLVPAAYGVFYLVGFFASYGAFLLIGRFRRLRGRFFALPATAAAFAVIPVWFLYIVGVGGDFMEYRFVVPVLPVLAMLAAYLFDHFRSTRRQIAVVGIAFAMSAFHLIAPNLVYPVLPFQTLHHWPSESKTNWLAMGKLLQREFPGELGDAGRPTIAVAPLGVISYYSDLNSVDMLGLTDAGIARHGSPISLYYPGHLRMATVGQLMDRHVDLIIGEPLAKEQHKDRTFFLSELVTMYPDNDLRQLPRTTKVVEIELQPGYDWYVLYPKSDPVVDRRIAANHWPVLDINWSCRRSDLPNFVIRWLAEPTCGPT